MFCKLIIIMISAFVTPLFSVGFFIFRTWKEDGVEKFLVWGSDRILLFFLKKDTNKTHSHTAPAVSKLFCARPRLRNIPSIPQEGPSHVCAGEESTKSLEVTWPLMSSGHWAWTLTPTSSPSPHRWRSFRWLNTPFSFSGRWMSVLCIQTSENMSIFTSASLLCRSLLDLITQVTYFGTECW